MRNLLKFHLFAVASLLLLLAAQLPMSIAQADQLNAEVESSSVRLRPVKPGKPDRPGRPTPGGGSSSLAGTYVGTFALASSKTFNGPCTPSAQLPYSGVAVERVSRRKTLVTFTVDLTGVTSVTSKGEKKSKSKFETKVTVKGTPKTTYSFNASSLTSAGGKLALSILTKKGRKKQCLAKYTSTTVRDPA